MISTVNFEDFSDSFTGGYKDNFTYEGKKALFDYLEDFEEETGEQLELDPIAFCVEYTEYDNLKEIQDNYTDITSLEDLRDNTTVIECDNGHLILQDY